MIATLQWLGIVPSFSRPHACNDNPYSEGPRHCAGPAPVPRVRERDARVAFITVRAVIDRILGHLRRADMAYARSFLTANNGEYAFPDGDLRRRSGVSHTYT